MTSPSFPSSKIVAFVCVVACLGCSSGEDVYLETTASKENALCAAAAGDDVCGRAWAELADDGDRAASRATVEAAAALASLADKNLQHITEACGRTLDDLMVMRPTFPPSSDASLRAKTTCEWAVSALRAKKPSASAFTLTTTQAPSCTPAPTPSCATLETAARVDCAPAAVTVAFHEGATDQDKRVGEIARRNASVILQTKASLDEMAKLASTLSSGVTGASATTTTSARTTTPTCAPHVARWVGQAVAEVTLAVTLTNDLASVIE